MSTAHPSTADGAGSATPAQSQPADAHRRTTDRACGPAIPQWEKPTFGACSNVSKISSLPGCLRAQVVQDRITPNLNLLRP